MLEMILTFTFCMLGVCALVIVCGLLEHLDKYIKRRFKTRYTPLEYMGMKLFERK